MDGADIASILEFYASPLGRYASRIIEKAVLKVWHPPEGEEGAILGLGYAVPFLKNLTFNPRHTLAFGMLEEQGACPVLTDYGNSTALVDPQHLPFRDGAFDRIICAHAFEQSPLSALLHEMERVLLPLGEAIIIIPNRQGLWARVESTPWAFGNPYSLKRIKLAFSETNLMINQVLPVLYTPPTHKQAILALHAVWEGLGYFCPQQWAGLYVIRVIKQVYATVQPRAVSRYRRSPLLRPSPIFCKSDVK